MENYPVIDESGNVRSAAVVEDYLVHITGNATPEEEDILLNVKKLYFKMKSFDHIDLSFDAKMQVDVSLWQFGFEWRHKDFKTLIEIFKDVDVLVE